MANFDENTVQQVWNKGVSGVDPAQWRKDECSAWIKRSAYGDRNSKYGWEIHHIIPEADNGSDNINNLRPLHWKNNLKTSDGRLSCPVKSNGSYNTGI